MKKLFLALSTLLIPVICFGNEPIFALRILKHWASVLGADSPRFALYEDGTVIFRPINENSDTPFYSGKLKLNKKEKNTLFPDQRNKFREKVAEKRENEIQRKRDNGEEYYELSGGDLTEFIWQDEIVRTGKFTIKELDQIEILVSKIRETKADPWLPEYIEVMFWPYEYAPEESIIWPENWPDLQEEKTKKRGKESYSVYVESRKFKKVKAFLRTRNQKGAVLINGKKMSAAIRFPFPGEELWM